MERERTPDLGGTKHDLTVAVLRAAAGACPFVGQGLVELIDYVIPNQRIERVEIFVQYLADRLNTLKESEFRSRLQAPESIDLFEDGCLQSARALSDERRQQIATLVADGIADAACEYIESKRVLRFLGELDDAEIIMLGAYLLENRTNEYRRRHAHVLKEPTYGYQTPTLSSSQQKVDEYTVHHAGKLHLLQLGLLEEHRSKSTFQARPMGPRGLYREEARTQSTHLRLSGLGHLLLRRIGIAR